MPSTVSRRGGIPRTSHCVAANARASPTTRRKCSKGSKAAQKKTGALRSRFQFLWRGLETRDPECLVFELVAAFTAEAVAGRNTEHELRRGIGGREVQTRADAKRVRKCEADVVTGKVW